MYGNAGLEALAAGVRKHDPQAYHSLFNLYFRKMVLFAEYFLMDRDEAEDIVQEIFADLWATAHRLPEMSNLRSYLFVQVRNRCLNSLKHLAVEDRYRQWLAEAQEYAEIEEEDIDRELVDKVYATIEELPAQARTIFKRCVLDGCKYRQVADEMGLSVHTVNTQMKRSYKFLRDRLGASFLVILVLIS